MLQNYVIVLHNQIFLLTLQAECEKDGERRFSPLGPPLRRVEISSTLDYKSYLNNPQDLPIYINKIEIIYI
jgi:hypothetical protein